VVIVHGAFNTAGELVGHKALLLGWHMCSLPVAKLAATPLANVIAHTRLLPRSSAADAHDRPASARSNCWFAKSVFLQWVFPCKIKAWNTGFDWIHVPTTVVAMCTPAGLSGAARTRPRMLQLRGRTEWWVTSEPLEPWSVLCGTISGRPMQLLISFQAAVGNRLRHCQAVQLVGGKLTAVPSRPWGLEQAFATQWLSSLYNAAQFDCQCPMRCSSGWSPSFLCCPCRSPPPPTWLRVTSTLLRGVAPRLRWDI